MSTSRRTRRARCLFLCLASVLAGLAGSARAAGEYPLALTLDATAATPAATVTSSVTVRVDRLMDEGGRKRVTDALTYGGFVKFLPALRTLPAIGSIALAKRAVDIRYAREQLEGTGRRLVLVADRPLFFLSGDAAKDRTAFELTVVELHFDAQGGVTGTMAGAARVKPSPDGPVLSDFAEAPVRLAVHVGRP